MRTDQVSPRGPCISSQLTKKSVDMISFSVHTQPLIEGFHPGAVTERAGFPAHRIGFDVTGYDRDCI